MCSKEQGYYQGQHTEHTERAEKLAEQFHETYERLAVDFSYKTREESAVPWCDVPNTNKRLMIAVCEELLALDPPTQLSHLDILK